MCCGNAYLATTFYYYFLQDNLDELSKSEHVACYESVVEQLRIQAKNPVLNPLLVTACGNVMRQHCTKEVKCFSITLLSHVIQ